ncbi:adenylyltransferase/cytidyltransferase family protein [bacterium]|nr:adenylyltransferase/cytidyltransferase family protein [bacterium]
MKLTNASSKKIISSDELVNRVASWRRENQTIVFTNGVFDLLHRGHIYSLESAAEFADHLVVGVNSDDSTRALCKGSGRPYINEHDRAILVASIAVVDLVIVFNEETPYELLNLLRPDVLVKGSDYKLDEVIGREFAGRVELIDRVEGISTTELIQKISRTLRSRRTCLKS